MERCRQRLNINDGLDIRRHDKHHVAADSHEAGIPALGRVVRAWELHLAIHAPHLADESTRGSGLVSGRENIGDLDIVEALIGRIFGEQLLEDEILVCLVRGDQIVDKCSEILGEGIVRNECLAHHIF